MGLALYYISVYILMVPLMVALVSPIVLVFVFFISGSAQAAKLISWVFIGCSYWLGVHALTINIPGAVWVDMVGAMLLGAAMGVTGWLLFRHVDFSLPRGAPSSRNKLFQVGIALGFFEGYRTILIASYSDLSRFIPAIVCALLGGFAGYMMEWNFSRFQGWKGILKSGVVVSIVALLISFLPILYGRG